MKRLLIIALLATTINIYTMQKSFNYDTYKFNIPTQGLKVGDMFTITNVDPFASSQETLKDATGKDWAQKLSSVYPGGKTRPGKGISTYKVIAIPLAQKVLMQPAQKPVTKPAVTRPAVPQPSIARRGPAAQPTGPVAAAVTKAKPREQQAREVFTPSQKTIIEPGVQPQQVQTEPGVKSERATRVPAAEVSAISAPNKPALSPGEQLIKDKAQYETDLMKMPATNIGIALDSAIRNAYLDKLELVLKVLKDRNIVINNIATLGLQKNPLQIAVTALISTPQKIKVLELLKNAGTKFMFNELSKDIDEGILAADYDLTKWLIEYGLANNALNRAQLEGFQATAEKYAKLYGADKRGALTRIKALMTDALKKVNQ